MLWATEKDNCYPWVTLVRHIAGLGPLQLWDLYWRTSGFFFSFFFCASCSNVVSSMSSIIIWQTWPSFCNQSLEGKDKSRSLSVNSVLSLPHAQPLALPRDPTSRTGILNNCEIHLSLPATLGRLALSLTQHRMPMTWKQMVQISQVCDPLNFP